MRILEFIKELNVDVPNMNEVSYTEIKKILEGSFMNDAGSNAVITEDKEIKSRSNMRRWMRMGPIHPKRYHSIDHIQLDQTLSKENGIDR